MICEVDPDIQGTITNEVYKIKLRVGTTLAFVESPFSSSPIVHIKCPLAIEELETLISFISDLNQKNLKKKKKAV